MIEGSRVLVLGGTGFVGSHVADRFADEGAANVVVMGHPGRGQRRWRNQCECIDVDLQRRVPNLSGFDIVVQMAAKIAGLQYNTTHNFHMLDANMRIALNVMQALKVYKPKLSIIVSSACIYPLYAPIPTPESAGIACDPATDNYGYGVAKWAQEQQGRLLHKECGIDVVVARFFNAIGPRDYYDRETSHAVPALIRKVMECKTGSIDVWGSGQQTRSFQDARDLAKAVVMLVETPAAYDAQPVNIGNDQLITIRELAEMIVRLSGKDIKLVFDPSKPEGVRGRMADSHHLRELIGWMPDTPLEKTIADMIEDYKWQKKVGLICEDY